jgi:F-type H+-transporting ATPase subunit b
MSDGFYEALATYSQVVASGLFIIALVVIWNKYLAPAVVASQARKNAELVEAERRRDEAAAAVEAAQREAARADDEARAIRARAEADAARVRERILADAKAEGERLVRNAEGELERGRAAAREALRADLLEKAMSIARDAARHLDDATNRRLVGDAVEVVERSARGGAA